jgi:hypothetical protein
LNLAYGWCTITALGRFDPKKGGHLVIPELRLAIEFPPGSSILIPSAALTHYNLDICKEETRGSVTQFSAGGLFRWVAYGHQLKSNARAASVEGKKWWDKGKGLYEVWPRSGFEESPSMQTTATVKPEGEPGMLVGKAQ